MSETKTSNGFISIVSTSNSTTQETPYLTILEFDKTTTPTKTSVPSSQFLPEEPKLQSFQFFKQKQTDPKQTGRREKEIS